MQKIPKLEITMTLKMLKNNNNMCRLAIPRLPSVNVKIFFFIKICKVILHSCNRCPVQEATISHRRLLSRKPLKHINPDSCTDALRAVPQKPGFNTSAGFPGDFVAACFSEVRLEFQIVMERSWGWGDKRDGVGGGESGTAT